MIFMLCFICNRLQPIAIDYSLSGFCTAQVGENDCLDKEKIRAMERVNVPFFNSCVMAIFSAKVLSKVCCSKVTRSFSADKATVNPVSVRIAFFDTIARSETACSA
jgi:hypothetical protein